MADMGMDDESTSRLEGTTGKEKGGLVIMKKGSSGDQHEFKIPSAMAPRASILGLDKLAALKRKQDEENKESKKSKILSYANDEDDDDSVEEEERLTKKESKDHKERFLSLFV